uniref:Uncharacterized protein n=1 Tax=Anolis carolinensis TaxID=28377 RepID=H9GD54_ANOCA
SSSSATIPFPSMTTCVFLQMKTEEMKVAYLSHGLQHLSHLVLDSPDKLHFLREDGSYKGSVRAPFPMMGLLYATEVDQFVAWDAGGLQVLNARLQPLSQASSPCPIRCGLYCQELNRIVTAGERNLTLWDFRYGHRSLHCRLSVDLGSEDTITHLALDEPVPFLTGAGGISWVSGLTQLVLLGVFLRLRVITDITYCDVTGCIVTASRDTTIKVWDDNWHIQTVFVGHTGEDNVPFIFSASQDGTIRTWNLSTTDQVDQVHTSEPVETLETLSISRVASCSAASSTSGRSTSSTRSTRRWGLPFRRLSCVNIGGSKRIIECKLCCDMNVFFMICSRVSAVFFLLYLSQSFPPFASVFPPTSHPKTASLHLYTHDPFLPIMGHKDGLLSVMEWFSGRIQCQVKAHSPRAVTALAEYPTQMCVISAGNDRTVKMWRLFPYADECLVPLLSFSCAAPATHMCSLGPTLAMAFQDPQTVTHRVVYYNLMEQSRSEHGPEEDAEDDITGLCCCPNLRLFASSSRDGSVKIWNMKNQMLGPQTKARGPDVAPQGPLPGPCPKL